MPMPVPIRDTSGRKHQSMENTNEWKYLSVENPRRMEISILGNQMGKPNKNQWESMRILNTASLFLLPR